MNKEEIEDVNKKLEATEEDIKEIKESIEEAYRCYDYDLDYEPFSKGIAEIVERILTCLEKKQSILDKVTDKLKEIRRELDDDGFDYYAQEITKVLNIIEGEKK